MQPDHPTTEDGENELFIDFTPVFRSADRAGHEAYRTEAPELRLTVTGSAVLRSVSVAKLGDQMSMGMGFTPEQARALAAELLAAADAADPPRG